jgi:hypothetical protein
MTRGDQPALSLIDDLIVELQTKHRAMGWNGDHTHTAGKAMSYLLRPHTTELERLVRAALASGKWDDLANHMLGWW